MGFTFQFRPTNLDCREPVASQGKFAWRPYLLLFVVLLGLTSLLCAPVLSQRATRIEAPTGTLKGIVYNIEEGNSPSAPITVVAVRPGIMHEVTANEDGSYRMTLAPGVYNFYIRNAAYDAARLVKHRVQPGVETMVDFDLSPPLVYCTIDGERVTPTGLAKFDTKDLRRPRHDVFDLPGPDPEKLNVVVEYCQRSSNNGVTRYTSASLMSDATGIFGDNLSFDSNTYDVFAFDTNVTVVQHERRASRVVTAKEPIASFAGGVPRVSFGSPVAGEGALERGRNTFDFTVSRDSFSFIYHDRAEGLELRSNENDCSFSRVLSTTEARFSGSATVTGKSHRLRGRLTPFTVSFDVRVVDYGKRNKGKDIFSIEIPEIGYKKLGQRLASGDIQILQNANTNSAGLSRAMKKR